MKRTIVSIMVGVVLKEDPNPYLKFVSYPLLPKPLVKPVANVVKTFSYREGIKHVI